MSTKTKTPPNGATGATASSESNYRTNPEYEAKIENWKKQHPDDWNYIAAMPIDRLRNTIVLNDVRRLEARARINGEIMTEIKNDPTRKEAYDILTKDMPEEQREEFILKAEREKRNQQKSQSQSQAQAKTKKEAVGVGV